MLKEKDYVKEGQECRWEGLKDRTQKELAALAEKYQMADSHVHVYPEKIAGKAADGVGNFYHIKIHNTGTVAALLEEGERFGIHRFLIQSVATSPEQVRGINRFISQECSSHPGKLIGFGTLHPKTESPQEEILWIERLGLRGVKLHPDFQQFCIDDRALYPIYEQLEGRLPILMHMGDFRYEYSHPRRLKKVLEDFPRLTVIGAHFGGWSVWDEAEEYLADTDCYVDTSSSFSFMDKKRAEGLIRTFGTERVLFGTDFPMWDYGEELKRFFSLELTEAQFKQICSGNLTKLLDLSESEGRR